MAGNSNLVLDSFNWLQNNVAGFLVELVLAVLILLIGFSIGRFSYKLTDKILREVEIDKLIRLKGRLSARKVISEIILLFIYFATILIVLNRLGVTGMLLTAIGAILIALSIASFFLGFMDFFPNIFAGILLQNRSAFSKGDFIECGRINGTIVNVGLTQTGIQTKTKDFLMVPNYHLYTNSFKARKTRAKAN